MGGHIMSYAIDTVSVVRKFLCFQLGAAPPPLQSIKLLLDRQNICAVFSLLSRFY